MDPEKEYQTRLDYWTQQERFHDQRHRWLGTVRVIFAVILVILVFAAGKTFFAVGIAFTGLILGLFLTGKIHDVVLKSRESARRGVKFHQAGLNRVHDKWAGQGAGGAEFLDPHHPYAIDLDIFGPGSLFELLNTTQTQLGRATLAAWLLQRAPIEEIRARQTAVAELRDKTLLREDLALLSADSKNFLNTDVLIAWANAPSLRVSPAIRVIAFCFPILTWTSFATGQILLFGVSSAAQSLFAYFYANRTKQILGALKTPAHELDWLADLFRRLEREPCQTPRLRNLQSTWTEEGAVVSHRFRRLARLVDWLDSRENTLLALIGPFFLMGTQFAFALETRRSQFAAKVESWLQALAEMEAFSSLACYSFDHPNDVFPELLSETSPVHIEAKDLGHPLIPNSRTVRNEVGLDANRRLLVISGSNMSGKSTYLRALGVNVVLALAGAPVRALQMRLTPLPVGASIRTVDSLNEGISRFYAEIKRLRQLIELTEQNGRLLFLIDEILNGTNSHDRRIGAASVVKSLLARGAVGLITTHDLALTQIVEEVQPAGANFHFEDQFADNRMSFDYRLRAGVVAKSNALELMRSIGLDVSADPKSTQTV